MTEAEQEETVYRRFYEKSIESQFIFGQIAIEFAERHFRYDSDLEDKLVEELRKFAKECCVKWYKGRLYVFDGKIYVQASLDSVQSAFKMWLSRIGLKIAQKRKRDLFLNDFMSFLKIGNKLEPKLDIVAFTNGVLELKDGSFHDFSPEYHVMYYHPYKFDKKAKCTKWQNFLKEVLPDKQSRMILQMFLGLGLVERGTVYNQYEGKDHPKIELCLILIGEGANGKSVIYQTAMGLYGKERISGVDYDELTSGGDEGMRARLLLRDAIFNWSSDSEPRTFGRKRTGVFKRIVSGEPVTMRAIGSDVMENYHLPYLIFNLNELPYPDDSSLGFMRRLQFISFDVTIPKSRQDATLAQKLTDEYPGIFNWVYRGMKEIRKRKFHFPDAEGSRRQLLLAQLQGNPVVAWINSYHIRSIQQAKGEQGIWVTSKDLMACLSDFCIDNDVEMPSKQCIGHTMSRFCFEKRRRAEGFEYKFYGVSMGDLLNSFVIRNESFKIEDEYKINESCLDDND